MNGAAQLVSYFVAFMLAAEAYRMVRKRNRRLLQSLALIRGYRWRHLGQACLVILATAASAAVLLELFGEVAWLTTGWWGLLGGKGNVLLANSDASSGQGASAVMKVLGVLVPVLLLMVLPLSARWEERVFRRGMQRDDFTDRIARQLKFGLIHMLVGIGLLYAMVLAVVGMAYLGIYLRSQTRTGLQGPAVLEATRAHALTNTILVSLVLLLQLALVLRAS